VSRLPGGFPLHVALALPEAAVAVPDDDEMVNGPSGAND
jgi:hypothetical protein